MKRTGMGLFIKIFAIILMILSILGGIAIGVGYSQMYYDAAPYVILGIVIGVLGALSAVCLFAFGQMYDDVRNIRNRVYGQRPQGMPRGMAPGAMPPGAMPQSQRPQPQQRPNPVMDMFRKPKAEEPAAPQTARPFEPATPAAPAAPQTASPFEPATPATPAAPQAARPFEPATPAASFEPATPAASFEPAAPAADFEEATPFRPASQAQTVAAFEEAVPFEEAPAFTPSVSSAEDVRAAVEDISDAADKL